MAGEPYSAAKVLNLSPIGEQKLSFDEIYAKLAPSTVLVQAGRQYLGAGIIVRSDGVILTNAHVVDRGYRRGAVTVTLQNERSYSGTIIGSEDDYDLALLKIESPSDLAAVTWADYARKKQEDEQKELRRMALEPIYALGFPYGKKWRMTEGKLSYFQGETSVGRWTTPKRDLFSEPGLLAPGNSGGPLINAYGQVIGVNYGLSGDNGVSISLETIQGFLDEVLPKIIEKSDRFD